jgi:hypothetical protein
LNTAKEKLNDHLLKDGWKIEKTLVDDLEEWAVEIWQIQSVWMPTEIRGYLTFLLDPNLGEVDVEEQIPYKVGASVSHPKSEQEAGSFCSMTLDENFDLKVGDFFLDLGDLRDCG